MKVLSGAPSKNKVAVGGIIMIVMLAHVFQAKQGFMGFLYNCVLVLQT